MRTPLRILVFVSGISLAPILFAAAPIHDYSDKTVAELLELLENKDSTVRECAAMFLGERYRNPKLVIAGFYPNRPSPELPIPAQVVPRLTEHLKTDPDSGVRACAVFALRDLRFRTNTTPILVAGLDDKAIRVRTCTALIKISQDYSEPLVERVIPTLDLCLVSDGKVENIWQAAYAAEPLGARGKPLIPALMQLTEHDSPEVRHYAERALWEIEQPGKKKWSESAFGQAQLPTAATNYSAGSGLLFMTNPTNAASISNAVMVASGLRVGMPEADVQKYMREHGMSQTNVDSLILDRGQTSVCPYPLAGGTSTLMLEMRSSKVGPGLFGWENPVLIGAHIHCNGATVTSITLTNGP